uniref:Cdc42 homolog n=1 Tax=Culex pipiens TaxID=7175 RepID=A0A8D8K8C2_CULPI
MPKVKCVVLGDGFVGKTCMLMSYTVNQFPVTRCKPATLHSYQVPFTIGDDPWTLQLISIVGQHDFDRLRLLTYPETDVFLVCFSVVNPDSFQNVRKLWVPELRQHCPGTPFLLVGTQIDRRQEIGVLKRLTRLRLKPVTRRQGVGMAREVRSLGYVECSALTQRGLQDVFDRAILAALDISGDLDGKNKCRVM